MYRSDDQPGGNTPRPDAAPQGEGTAFVASWIRGSLPLICKSSSVVGLAAQLRAQASDAGVDLGELGTDPFRLERMILTAVKARITSE